MIAIAGLDHIALTSDDIDASVGFYRRVLGAEIVNEIVVDGVLVARQLRIGGAMLNIHRAGNGKAVLVAARPTSGSGDLCFRWSEPIETALALLRSHGVEVLAGPVERLGGDSRPGRSVYFRDPDANLLELLSSAG